MIGLRPAIAALVLSAAASSSANAACVRIGNAVTCTGTTSQNFVTLDTVTLTIVREALVSNMASSNTEGACPLTLPVIVVGPRSQVINNGNVVGTGICATGVLTGDGSTVTSDGFVATIDNVSHGFDVGDDATVSNNGRISTLGVVSHGIFAGRRAAITLGPQSSIEAAAGHGVAVADQSRVDMAGTITVRGTFAAGIDSGGGPIAVRGRITAIGRASRGVRADGNGVDVNVTGFIVAESNDPTSFAGTATGVMAGGADVRVTNTGLISGQRHAIALEPITSGAIINSGELKTSFDFGFAPTSAVISVRSAASVVTSVTNRGTITAEGRRPAITGGDGMDIVQNFGTVTGDVILGNGADSFTFESGSALIGALDLGDGDDQVAFNGSGDFAGAIVRAETITKGGSGTWTIRGDVAAQNTAVILGGTLALAGGRLAAPTVGTVGSGVLSGNGVIDGHLVNGNIVDLAGGARLTIAGDFRQSSTGTLRVPGTAGALPPINVGGQVILAGTLDAGFSGRRLRGGESFDLFATRGTVTGQFDRVIGVGGGFLSAVVERAGAADVLRLRIARVRYASAAASTAQLAVAGALDRSIARNDSALTTLFDTLDGLPASAAAPAFDRLAPQIPTAVVAAGELAARSTTSTISQWLELGPTDGAPGTLRTWGQITLRAGRSDNADAAGKFRFRSTQAVAGFDQATANGTRIGMALVGQDGDIAALSQSDRADVNPRAIAVYAGTAGTMWRAVGAVFGGRMRPTWMREGFAGPVAARAKLNLLGGFATITYAETWGPFIAKASAGIAADYVKLAETTEAGAFGLRTLRHSRSSWRPSAGVRLVSRPGTIHPYLGMSLSHDPSGAKSLDVSFATSPTTQFALSGPRLRATALAAQAGVNSELGPGLMARIGFDGDITDSLADRGAIAGLSFRW